MKTLTRTAMRALAIAATVATSATAMAAQVVARAAAPATTPTTSVLLGVQGCSYGICDPPTTLLLVRQGDSVRVTGRGAGLLVPRRDGFWWLLAQDGYTGGDRGYDRDEPTPDGLTTCDSILLGLRPPLPKDSAASDSTPPDEPTEAAAPGDDPWRPSGFAAVRADATGVAPRVVRTGEYGRLTWLWVGSDWAAFEEYQSVREDEEHTRESWHQDILSLDEFARPATDTMALVSFDPKAPPFRRAARECLQVALDAAETDNDREWIRSRSYIEWTVRRRPTYWSIAPSLHESDVITDQADEPCTAPRGLGASMIGHDRMTIAWSAIKDVLPEAKTAFESPTGDVLVVQQDSTLYAFLPRAGRLGAPVARIPAGMNVVMAQWAVGAHAARWAREVPPLLTKGAPAFPSDSTSKR